MLFTVKLTDRNRPRGHLYTRRLHAERVAYAATHRADGRQTRVDYRGQTHNGGFLFKVTRRQVRRPA